jgi:hypothetical protein
MPVNCHHTLSQALNKLSQIHTSLHRTLNSLPFLDLKTYRESPQYYFYQNLRQFQYRSVILLEEFTNNKIINWMNIKIIKSQ